MFENGKHHILFAQRTGVLDTQFLGIGEKVWRGFGFQILKIHVRTSGSFTDWDEMRHITSYKIGEKGLIPRKRIYRLSGQTPILFMICINRFEYFRVNTLLFL